MGKQQGKAADSAAFIRGNHSLTEHNIVVQDESDHFSNGLTTLDKISIFSEDSWETECGMLKSEPLADCP